MFSSIRATLQFGPRLPQLHINIIRQAMCFERLTKEGFHLTVRVVNRQGLAVRRGDRQCQRRAPIEPFRFHHAFDGGRTWSEAVRFFGPRIQCGARIHEELDDGRRALPARANQGCFPLLIGRVDISTVRWKPSFVRRSKSGVCLMMSIWSCGGRSLN